MAVQEVTEDLEFDVLLHAALQTAKLPSVSVIAYTGNPMFIAGVGEVVIDLAGLDASGSIPLLADHDSSLAGIVGHGQAQVTEGRLVVTGTISAATDSAKQIVASARNGFAFQASIGAQVLERRRLTAGENVIVNQRSITAQAGGLVLVTRSRLREVSVVALGADGNTSVSIAASWRKNMSKEGQVQEVQADAAEVERVEAINRICGNRHADIAARAVADNWDANRTELEVLRADRPKAPAAHIISTGGTTTTIEAALLMHMGKPALGEKLLGPMAMEQAEAMGTGSMIDLCRAALRIDGIEMPRNRMEMVKASMSTYSLPTALGNVANKVLLDAYNETPATWRSFCAIRNVPDFKLNTGIRPSFTGGLERVAPGGELKHGTVGEWTVQYSVDTFGKLLSVDRRDIINDDLGVFMDTSATQGRAAMRKLSDLVYEVMLANAGGFFGAGNGNYFDGADSVLAMDSLAKAITLMRTQRDDEGNDLDLKPAVLLIGPELEPTARALLNSEFIQRPENVPTGNSLKEAVSLEVEPRLSNTKKYAASASAKHWYLLASPSASPIVVAFLNGVQTPTTEYFGLEQNVEKLAVSWRVYFDFGAALCDPRAAVRSKGQA
jgi:hypothetical protein